MKLRVAASFLTSAALGLSVLSSCGESDPPAPGTQNPNPAPGGTSPGDSGAGGGGEPGPGGSGGENPDDPNNPEDEGGDPCLRNKGGVVWESQIRKIGGKGLEVAAAATAFDAQRGRLFLGLSGLLDIDGASSVSTHSLFAFTTKGQRMEWESRHAGEYVGLREFVTGIGVNPDGSAIMSVREMRGTKGPTDQPIPVFQGWLGHFSDRGKILSEDVFEQTEANPESVGPRPSSSSGLAGGGLIEGGSSDFDSEEFPGNAFKAYFRVYDEGLKVQNTFYYAAPEVDASTGGLTDVREVRGLEDGGSVAIVEGIRSANVVYTYLVRFDPEGEVKWELELGSLTEYDPSGLTVTDKGEIWVSGAHNHYKGKAPEDRESQLKVPFWRKYWVAQVGDDGKIAKSFEGAVPGSSMARPDDATMANSVAIDRVGNIWLAGTDSVNVLDAPEGWQCQHYAWVKKLDAEGKELWHTEMTTTEYKYRMDHGVSVHVDDNCNGYLVANYSRFAETGQKCKLAPAVTKVRP